MAAPNNHFRILEDIARDLSSDVNFPTCMNAAVLVRNTLRDPYANLSRVVQVIGVEPLISSKLLKLANSVAYNPSGKTLSELEPAISRLGFEVVRTASLAVAMDQMLKSRNLSSFAELPHNVWEHSLRVAAIARVLARHIGRINPDEAMLAGLVHDLGIFYLLYRASEYPEYTQNKADILELICGWHESIGESLLHILGLPERIIDAVRDHDQPQNVKTPCSVRDVLYFANLLAGCDTKWLPILTDAEEINTRNADRERYHDLIAEADDDIAKLHAALAI